MFGRTQTAKTNPESCSPDLLDLLTSLQALFFVQVLLVFNHPSVYAAALSPKSSSRLALRANEKERCTSRKIRATSASTVSILPWCRFAMARSGMSALSSGESLLHWGLVSAANLGAIAEGADLVFVAGFINRLTGAFAINPAIHSPAELKGKSLGVNSLSGGTWIFTMLTLDHWGLSPAPDKIQMRALGDNSVVSQALLAGNVDAAYLSYTYAKIVQNRGFRVLADLEKLPIAFQGTGIITRRKTITSSAGTI